jgi:hypothetical protein
MADPLTFTNEEIPTPKSIILSGPEAKSQGKKPSRPAQYITFLEYQHIDQ